MRKCAVLLIFGTALIVGGILIWSTRARFSSDHVLDSKFGARLTALSPGISYDLTRECNVFTDREPWILFVLKAEQFNDDDFRTYFETTDNERVGLWVEYDPPLLRVGMGLGLESLASNTELPIQIVRKTQEFEVILAVSRDTTRMIANNRDEVIQWPELLGGSWRCDAVRVADGVHELASGNRCEKCEASLRYVTGSGFHELDDALDQISNTNEFKAHQILGNIIILIGIIMVRYAIKIIGNVLRIG